ncbi:hypothetical protein SK128_012538, partial [Halocaridina rubra]
MNRVLSVHPLHRWRCKGFEGEGGIMNQGKMLYRDLPIYNVFDASSTLDKYGILDGISTGISISSDFVFGRNRYWMRLIPVQNEFSRLDLSQCLNRSRGEKSFVIVSLDGHYCSCASLLDGVHISLSYAKDYNVVIARVV